MKTIQNSKVIAESMKEADNNFLRNSLEALMG